VKGSKHKRDKVLKEILLETTNNDAASEPPAATNGDLKDIPVPPSNGIPRKHEPEIANPPLPPLPIEKSAIVAAAVIKLTELPMPPGVIVPSDVKTPSPPKEPPSMMMSKKVKLTELPMPPTIAGTEELSEEEVDGRSRKMRGNGTARIQRPKIINRRLSSGPDGDWGERCVEVFEIIAQIGEGEEVEISNEF
jgi:hypothetical protein